MDTMEHNVDENTDKNFSSGIHTWTPIVSSCSKVKDITRRATSYDTGDPLSAFSMEFDASRPLFGTGYIRLSHFVSSPCLLVYHVSITLPLRFRD